MPTVASATLAYNPISFAYVATNLAAHAWVFPTNPAQTQLRLPSSNTSQMVILNTGAKPLLFGALIANSEADLISSTVIGVAAPYAFDNAVWTNAAAAAIVPSEGSNCTRITIGGSLTVDLGSFQQRGSYSPVPSANSFAPLSYPSTIIFFSAVGGDTTADITYINTFGIF